MRVRLLHVDTHRGGRADVESPASLLWALLTRKLRPRARGCLGAVGRAVP